MFLPQVKAILFFLFLREHNTASSQENTNPSLPPTPSSIAQTPTRSPALPPGSNSNQGAVPLATSSLHTNKSNAPSLGHGPVTPTGYLITCRTNCPPQVNSLSPLSSPHTATSTSFMLPRMPRSSPGLGGNSRMPGSPFSPSTPGLPSPVGALSSGGCLNRQHSGGDGNPGANGGSSGFFPLSSPGLQRQASTPTVSSTQPPSSKPSEGGKEGGEDSTIDPPLSASQLGNPRHNQVLDSTGAEVDPHDRILCNSSPHPPTPSPVPQCPASHSSLTERHKILHKLLLDSSPNDTSSAATAATEDGLNKNNLEIKKEAPASPALNTPHKVDSREPQDHQLLRFLLDTDEKVTPVTWKYVLGQIFFIYNYKNNLFLKDLGDLPPPSALSLQTVRVKVEKRTSGEGLACSGSVVAAGGVSKPAGVSSSSACISPKSSPIGETCRDSKDSTVCSLYKLVIFWFSWSLIKGSTTFL